MNIYWISIEYLLNIYWISIEYLLNLYWIYFEYLLNIYWISIEYLLNIIIILINIYWISIEYLLNIYWISIEYLLNIYWMYIKYLLNIYIKHLLNIWKYPLNTLHINQPIKFLLKYLERELRSQYVSYNYDSWLIKYSHRKLLGKHHKSLIAVHSMNYCRTMFVARGTRRTGKVGNRQANGIVPGTVNDKYEDISRRLLTILSVSASTAAVYWSHRRLDIRTTFPMLRNTTNRVR